MDKDRCLAGLALLSVGRLVCSVAQMDLAGVVKICGIHSGLESVLTWVVTLGFG